MLFRYIISLCLFSLSSPSLSHFYNCAHILCLLSSFISCSFVFPVFLISLIFPRLCVSASFSPCFCFCSDWFCSVDQGWRFPACVRCWQHKCHRQFRDDCEIAALSAVMLQKLDTPNIDPSPWKIASNFPCRGDLRMNETKHRNIIKKINQLFLHVVTIEAFFLCFA